MAQRKPRRSEHSRMVSEREYLMRDMMSEAEVRRYSSRRKRKKKSVWLPVAGTILLLLVVFGIFGASIAQKYMPTKERKDLNEWFEVAGNEVKIYLNDAQARDVLAYEEGGEVYLPINWVNGALNKRFFWNPEEMLLCYTLPDETLYMRENDLDENGKPYFLMKEGGMYLSLSKIEAHTDLVAKRHTGEEEAAKRIFLYKDMGEIERATIEKNAALRTKGGIKAPILTDLLEGEKVTVLDQMEKWAKVSTETGFIGFVETKRLSETFPETFESGYVEPKVDYYDFGDEKIVMGWHQISGKAGNATFDEYYANTGGVMNVISPTWIQINSADGGYDNFSTREYMDKAHAAGLEVWVAVDNFNHPAGLKEFSTKTYFANSENRKDFISRLMADAETFGYDGINLDFESLPADAGPSYVQFYRELSVACRKAGLALSIDNYVPYQFNDHYDLGEQGVFADYVVIMGYDEHTNGSPEAGSVSSIGYTKFGIEETLKDVPAERIINGVPFFTRIWKSAGPSLSSDAMGMREAAAYVAENGYELRWDEESGQYYGELQQASGLRQVWMEDERSIGEKVKLIKEYDLAGVAAWRLNFEPPEIWEVMDLNK